MLIGYRPISDVGRQSVCTKIEDVEWHAYKFGEMYKNVVRRSAPPSMLDVVQILHRDRFAVVLLDGGGDLVLRKIEPFAPFGDKFPKSSHGRFGWANSIVLPCLVAVGRPDQRERILDIFGWQSFDLFTYASR